MSEPTPSGQQPGRREEVYGAAAERTELAWLRTVLGGVIGCFVVFATCVRLGAPIIGVGAAALGVVVGALFVFAFPVGRFRRGIPVNSWNLLLFTGLAVAALAGLSLLASTVLLLH